MPERSVGCGVTQLLVHHGQRVEDAWVIGTEDAEANEFQVTRVDNRALINQRSAVGELNLRARVGVSVSSDAQEVRPAAIWAVSGDGPWPEVGSPRIGDLQIMIRTGVVAVLAGDVGAND